MRVRYRLFVIVGSLFSAIFVGSFVLENRIESKGVYQIRQDLMNFYKSLEEDKRDSIQNILTSTLSEYLGNVNAALEVVSEFSRIQQYFAPTKRNIDQGTWKSAAILLQDREGIDFLQNSYDGKISSLILPKKGGMKEMYREEIDEKLCWVYTKEDRKAPLLGIQLDLKDENSHQVSAIENVPGIVPQVFVMYPMDRIEKLPIEHWTSLLSTMKDRGTISVPFLGGFFVDLHGFLDGLAKAKKFILQQKQDHISFSESDNPLPQNTHEWKNCVDARCFYNEKVAYVNQLFLIWELCSLMESGLMGDHVDSEDSPSAIGFFPDQTGLGQGIYVKDVLLNQPIFDAEDFFFKTIKEKKSSPFNESVALVTNPFDQSLYIVNAVELEAFEAENKKVGYLTLGFNIDNILRLLAQNFKQSAWIVCNGQVASSFSSSGEKFTPPYVEEERIQSLLKAPLGIFSFHDKSYYYVRIKPYQSLDLHFFLFVETDREFALVDTLNTSFINLMAKIKEQKQYVIALGLIILLIGLLDLSKKITGPVVAVSQATKAVKKGRLDDVHLPELHLGKNNEVQQLNDAFKEMIEGLKEKERVKGILDKVVSHDIAQEILEGNIHLGGEDKVVTIFFADVRSFTKLTQKMLPHEVIDLVNTCMTKLSRVIDAHGGVIDKYIGDEVMVLFGAPISKKDSALQAVMCGLEVMNELARWNHEREINHLAPVSMGIGIHTGKVCAGNMGAENRLNYTVIGSNVNLASRLCSQAKPGEVLLSNDTLIAYHVTESVEVEDMGMQHLKGFDDPVKVYKALRKKA
jgi:class 3 adenylate cyclase